MKRPSARRRFGRSTARSIAGVVATTLVGGIAVLLIAAALLGAFTGGGEGGPARAERCVRWYPDYCVPAGRGALDCDDVRSTPLSVEGADPFDFDGDLDGSGCESS